MPDGLRGLELDTLGLGSSVLTIARGKGLIMTRFDELLQKRGLTRDNSVVVLVDDEKSGRDAMRNVFTEGLGLNVATAVDGNKGLNVISHCRGRVALVLSDMDMGHMSGVEMVTSASEGGLLSNVPTVIMTARFLENAGEILTAIDEGHVSASIQKPFAISELISMIEVASHKILEEMEKSPTQNKLSEEAA